MADENKESGDTEPKKTEKPVADAKAQAIENYNNTTDLTSTDVEGSGLKQIIEGINKENAEGRNSSWSGGAKKGFQFPDRDITQIKK
jgi:hypothetical protein